MYALPVISDTVEEAIAVVHHGSHRPQDCGVAHQTGWQHKVTTTTTADTNTAQLETDRDQASNFHLDEMLNLTITICVLHLNSFWIYKNRSLCICTW